MDTVNTKRAWNIFNMPILFLTIGLMLLGLVNCNEKKKSGVPCVGAMQDNNKNFLDQMFGNADKDKGAPMECAATLFALSASGKGRGTVTETYDDGKNIAITTSSVVALSPPLAVAGSKYTVSPTLPGGLSLDPNTGIISGTPVAILVTTTFTVTQTSSDGTIKTWTFTITVSDAGTVTGTYEEGMNFALTTSSIVKILPPYSATGSTFTVSPTLPGGLSLDPNSGVISGTPVAILVTTTYTITETYTDGKIKTWTFTITVTAPTGTDTAPTSLTYTGSPYTYTQNTAIATNTPAIAPSGVTITSCTSSPTLPAGLSISATTCAISGTPTVTSTATTYTITAINASGSKTATISIAVNSSVITGTPSFAITNTGTNGVGYTKSVTDSSNNLYVIGSGGASATYTFGNSVTATGSSGAQNLVVVKYNSSGIAQLAYALTSASNSNIANSIGIDSSGNIYITGYLKGNGSFDFGNGQTVTGLYVGVPEGNYFVAKLNSSFVVQWVKTLISPTNQSVGNDIKVVGNYVYVCGYAKGSFTANFGNSQTISLTSGSLWPFLAKYDLSGTVQWVKTLFADPVAHNAFYEMTALSNGTIVVGGIAASTTGPSLKTVYYSATVTFFSNNSASQEMVFVAYDSSGTPLWAKGNASTTNSIAGTVMRITTDSSDNMYISLAFNLNCPNYDFGNGVTGTLSTTVGQIGAILKLNSSGTAQWFKAVSQPGGNSNSNSIMNGLAVDSSGNLYVASSVRGNTTYDFGNSVTLTGGSSGAFISTPFLIKFDSSGTAQWLKSATGVTSTAGATYFSISIDSAGALYTVGQMGNTTLDFGNGLTVVSSSSGGGALIVKYQ